MTNIEKWLIEQGFKIDKKEVEYYPMQTETVSTYAICFGGSNVFEAKVYLYTPLLNSMNCCEIKAKTALFINRYQKNDKDEPYFYASRKPEVLHERTEQAVFLLKTWAKEMDEIENPFEEAEEELK